MAQRPSKTDSCQTRAASGVMEPARAASVSRGGGGGGGGGGGDYSGCYNNHWLNVGSCLAIVRLMAVACFCVCVRSAKRWRQ